MKSVTCNLLVTNTCALSCNLLFSFIIIYIYIKGYKVTRYIKKIEGKQKQVVNMICIAAEQYSALVTAPCNLSCDLPQKAGVA